MTRSDRELTVLAETVFDSARTQLTSTREQVEALHALAPAAYELALLAFKDKHPTAWRLVQNGVFALPMFKITSGRMINSRHRPFFRGDLVSAGIRDIIWEVEEQHMPRLEPPEPLVGEKAAEFIEAEFRRRSVQHHPMFQYLADTKMNPAQERAA